MKRVVFASVKNDGLELTDTAGKRLAVAKEGPADRRSAAGEMNRLVVISRLDYDVKILSIPRVPRKEERNLIGFRLRALHPGAPEETIFDFRTTDSPEGSRVAVVYLMRREVFEHYRPCAESGGLVTFDMLVSAVSHPEQATVLFRTAGYTDRMVFRDGSLVESTLVGHGDDASSSPAETIVGHSPGDYQNVRLPRTIAPLFRPARVGRFHRAPLLALCLSAAAVALFLVYGIRTVNHYQTELLRAKTRYEAVVTRYAGAAKDAQSYITTKVELETLLKNRPIDMYGFFASLSSALQDPAAKSSNSRVFVENVTLSNGTFSLEGTGAEPFRLSELLAARTGFNSVRVVQIVPAEKVSSVRFGITGEYDGR